MFRAEPREPEPVNVNASPTVVQGKMPLEFALPVCTGFQPSELADTNCSCDLYVLTEQKKQTASNLYLLTSNKKLQYRQIMEFPKKLERKERQAKFRKWKPRVAVSEK